MPELSSSSRHAKRKTFLSFQPPAISEAEIDAVAETLRSGWLTTGPRTAELEARMRDYLEAKHVLAVSSCTAALQDRKSTRLNSSHPSISYAVFCLKKKNK